MKGLTTAEAHAKTEAKMCKNGYETLSSATFTNIRGKKQTKKQRKMVNIILVNRMSSRRCADWAAFKAEVMAGLPEVAAGSEDLPFPAVPLAEVALEIHWTN